MTVCHQRSNLTQSFVIYSCTKCGEWPRSFPKKLAAESSSQNAAAHGVENDPLQSRHRRTLCLSEIVWRILVNSLTADRSAALLRCPSQCFERSRSMDTCGLDRPFIYHRSIDNGQLTPMIILRPSFLLAGLLIVGSLTGPSVSSALRFEGFNFKFQFESGGDVSAIPISKSCEHGACR